MLNIIIGAAIFIFGCVAILFSTGHTDLDAKDKAALNYYRDRYGYWMVRSSIAIMILGVVWAISPFV
ncbi:MAG: hypothetical protein CMN28_12910 [Salinisphaeraceae bacterium]|nr:hypothetical protein [Salinisphaeraceae bacterium]